MTQDDIQYFERRRRECIERAMSTQDPQLVAIYRSFAVQYMRVVESYTVANDDEEAA